MTARSAIFPDRPIRYRYRSNMADHRTDTDHNRSNTFWLYFLRNVNSSIFYEVIFQFQVILGIVIAFSVHKVATFGNIFFPEKYYYWKSLALWLYNFDRYRYRYFAVIGRSTDIHRSGLDRPITDNRYNDRSFTSVVVHVSVNVVTKATTTSRGSAAGWRGKELFAYFRQTLLLV